MNQREIKFRAWDGEKMIDPWFTIRREAGSMMPFILSEAAIEIMQFTGLHDKNGKEIYEGDIVQKHGEPSEHLVVGFEDEDFKGGRIPRYFGFPYYSYPEEWKVIGNIYSNPELLQNV